MTIDIDLSTPEGQVRAIIGDVSEPYAISSQMIEFILVETDGDTRAAAIKCLQYLVPYYAKLMDQTVGNVRYAYSTLYGRYKDLLDSLLEDPNMGAAMVLPILGGTSKSKMRENRRNPDTPYIGIRVGDLSKVRYPERDIDDPYKLS